MAKQTLPKTPATPKTPDAANPELPYPQIQYAANNNLLYPLDAKGGTVATITVANMQAAPVTLYWAIKDQDQPAFEPIVVPGSTSGSVEIPIPWQRVSTCIGHTVLIWYSATVNGRLQESLVLELEIQDVREADLRGSLPEFLNSTLEWGTWWLDMYEFQGDETIQIKAWPMIQAGQRLFVTVAGNQHQVPYRFIWVAFDHVVTAAEAHADHVFEFWLSRGWMSRLDDYSALTTHMGVIWDGTAPVLPTPDDPVHENPLPLNAQDFHLRTTTLLRVDPALDLPPPHLKESVDCGADGWVVNPLNTVRGGHIVITYEGIHAGDIVCPKFVGTPGAGSPSLECRTVQPGETSLEFLVPPSAFSANFGLPVTLTYTVSHSGTGPWLSPPRQVNILDITGLPTPAVEQATGGTLDLNTFSGDATATVEPWLYIALGQLCWLWVTGEREDGSAYSFSILEGEPVTEEWLASGVNTPLPRSELQKLADCSAFDVHFAVTFNGLSDKASAKQFPVLSLGIVQEDLVLKAPTVREAVGSQLTVWNGREGVTVRVEYDLINPNHAISVCWKRADGTCLPLMSKPGSSDPKYVDFQIPREAVIHGSGKTVTINYTVTSLCKVATSPDLDLQISVPVRLPTPVVPQATNNILDLRTFTGNADITVEKWWFILPDQKVWLRGAGTKKDGTPYTLNVFLGKAVTAGEVSAGLKDVLKRTDLESLRNLSSLTFTCKVTPDGSTQESASVVFPVLALTVRLLFDDLTTFDDDNWNGWEKGPAAADPRDLVIEHQGGNWYLYNWTYTNNSAGVFLFRNYSGLEVNRNYEFSMSIRRVNDAPAVPEVSMLAGGKTIVSRTPIPGQEWRTLLGVFTATATTMRLELYNHIATGSGNDYAVDNIRVREL
ncbi:hypothetical protein HZF02_10340 [Pseudomonas yamanorum]|nr:hypothetical protein HZF02_10340 [Pseudomonas yamanorum]